MTVRGTVSRFSIDQECCPLYITIYFKESPDGAFTAYSPESEAFTARYGGNLSGLVGKLVEMDGMISPFGKAKGSVQIQRIRGVDPTP
jgi:hypothetical protein